LEIGDSNFTKLTGYIYQENPLESNRHGPEHEYEPEGETMSVVCQVQGEIWNSQQELLAQVFM
jgi:hypothetical protein